jgi:hypothetical protein
MPTTGRRRLPGPQPGDRIPQRHRAVAVGAGSDQLGHVEVGECQLELGYFGDLQSGFGGAARPQTSRLFAGSFHRGATVEGDARDGQPGIPVDQ